MPRLVPFNKLSVQLCKIVAQAPFKVAQNNGKSINFRISHLHIPGRHDKTSAKADRFALEGLLVRFLNTAGCQVLILLNKAFVYVKHSYFTYKRCGFRLCYVNP